MERDLLVDRLRSLQDRLAPDGVTHLAMYGSRARGDHRPDSDLDVLVDIDCDRKFSLLDLIGVEHRIGDEIGVPVNAQMRRSLPEAFRDAIAADVVEIF